MPFDPKIDFYNARQIIARKSCPKHLYSTQIDLTKLNDPAYASWYSHSIKRVSTPMRF
jgi:hypothetical protein